MNNQLKIPLIVLITGVAGMLAAPFLFTDNSMASSGLFDNSVGTITTTISSLVGSILVFLALKGQIAANKIMQEQIRTHQMEVQRKKEIIYVSDLYKYFLDSIQSYETRYYKGHRAIMKAMSHIAESESKLAHDDNRLYYGTAAELYRILKLGKLFLEQVNKSGMEQHDKRYFKELIKHNYDSFILPYLTKNNQKQACPTCGEKHNGIPFKMRELIRETMDLLETQ